MDDITFAARRASSSSRPTSSMPKHASGSLVQSPLRAGHPALPERAPRRELRRRGPHADVRPHAARRRELPQRAGRASACVRRVAGRAADRTRRRGRPTTALAAAARHVPRAARRRQHRRPVALGAALPRDDRPRREDAGRLRMDPHRRQVGHLGADPRADRLRQGSRGADDPRAEPPRPGELPGGQLRRAARHALRVGDLRLRKGRLHRRARPQARPPRAGQRRHAASSTRSATCRSSPRPSCCGCSKSGGSSASAAASRSTSTSA